MILQSGMYTNFASTLNSSYLYLYLYLYLCDTVLDKKRKKDATSIVACLWRPY